MMRREDGFADTLLRSKIQKAGLGLLIHLEMQCFEFRVPLEDLAVRIHFLIMRKNYVYVELAHNGVQIAKINTCRVQAKLNGTLWKGAERVFNTDETFLFYKCNELSIHQQRCGCIVKKTSDP